MFFASAIAYIYKLDHIKWSVNKVNPCYNVKFIRWQMCTSDPKMETSQRKILLWDVFVCVPHKSAQSPNSIRWLCHRGTVFELYCWGSIVLQCRCQCVYAKKLVNERRENVIGQQNLVRYIHENMLFYAILTLVSQSIHSFSSLISDCNCIYGLTINICFGRLIYPENRMLLICGDLVALWQWTCVCVKMIACQFFIKILVQIFSNMKKQNMEIT